jgi:flagellar biosynthetic protein FliR
LVSVLEKLLLVHLGTFTLVLARVGALVMTAPIFGNKSIPLQGRALIAIIISLLVTPLLAQHTAVDMGNLAVFSKHLLSEALIGLLFGVGITILLNGVQITGQLVSQLGGTALAEVFDPSLEENVSVYSQFFYFLTLTMFVLLDGHRMTMGALLDSFAELPPGQACLGTDYLDAVITLLQHSFILGIRAGAPAMTALLLATLVLGLIGRTMPQINILAVGFGVNSLLSVGCLFTSIGVVAWAFPQQTGAAIDVLRNALTPLTTGS